MRADTLSAQVANTPLACLFRQANGVLVMHPFVAKHIC